MKKLLVVVVTLLMSQLAQAEPYGDVNLGLSNGNISGYSTEVRLGTELSNVDVSLGYNRISGDLDKKILKSNSLDLHTLNMEIYRKMTISDDLTGYLGGGVGYSIPNLSAERGDNDVSYILGAKVNYQMTDNWSLGVYGKGFFFRTDVKRTDTSSHIETLSNGQDVEIEDVTYFTDSVNLNSAVLGFNVRYNF